MANIPGTNVASTIAPFTTDDQFPTHDAIYGKGGQREVATIAERDAIPLARLTEGCTCYVAATEKTYRWKSNAWVDDTPAIATDASDIDYTPSGSSTPTNVAAALDSLNESVNNLDIPSDASDIDYTPSGSSTQTTVASALDSINESVSGLEDSVQGNADDIANLQEGAVAVDVNTTTKVFAIKNAKGQDVGTITVSETTGLPATLTLAKAGTNGQSITVSLPTLAYNSQTQMLEYVDATGNHVPTVKLSNLTIKYVGSTDPSTGDWALGDLILVGSNSSYELKVYDGNSTWLPLGSINNVSLVADQVPFDNSENGFNATNVQDAIDEVKSLISNASIKDIYPDLYPSVLYVVDGDGYIGLKLDANGFDIASISTHLISMIQNIAGSGGEDSGGEDSGGGDVTPSDGSTWLTGKRFVAIGASTSHLQTGVASWQEEFANRTGAIFYKSIQNDLAEPGARCISFVGNDKSDQFRLKLLKERIDNGQADNVDVIIFMNGNDNNFLNYGAISDTPFFQQQIVYSSTIYESLDAANNAFGKSAQVPGIAGGVFPNVDENNRIGTIGRLRYASSNSYVWKKLTINNNASSSGSFTLQVGDSNYLIPVTLGDTPSTIIEEILSNDSGDYVFEKVEGENAIKISISEASAVVSVIGASNLGINAVLTDYSSGGVSYKQVCFLSRNKNDWGDYTKWGTPSLCACFMGMLEYAMTNFPNTQLFVFSTPRFIDVMEGNKSSYLRADGTFDIYSWNANNKKTKDLASSVNVKRNACSLFNVPFLEVKTESNISVYNASSFYSSGGVHPLSVGYRRWGATLARLLTGK